MNTTNEGSLSQLLGLRSTPQVIAESAIYGAIAKLAFFGNLLVLCVVYKNPRLRNGPIWMVTSLAISDITMSSLCAPPSLAAMISGRWISGFFVCQVQGFLTMWLSCASLETMALMSVDRYYRVVRPVRHRTLFTAKRIKILSVVAWLFASTAPMPYIASGHVYVFHPGKMFCFHNQVLSLSSSVIYVHVVVSLVILSFCYLQVFRGLRENSKRVKNLRGVPANSSSRITKEDIRLTRTLFVTVLGFLLCWTPILVIDFIGMTRGEWTLKRWVFVMYCNCGLLSSCVNPIIYGAMNKTFRSHYKKLFVFRSREVENRERRTTDTPRDHPRDHPLTLNVVSTDD